MSCKSLDVQYGGYATETSRLVFKNVFKTLFIKKYMISIFPPNESEITHITTSTNM